MQDHAQLRVSDQERDDVVELLRGHLLAGRLEPDEHEERVAEACRARYGADLDHALRELPRPAPPAPPAPPTFVRAQRDSRPGTALAFGLTGIGLLLVTAGFGFVFSLPFSIVAWVIGARSARLPREVIGSTGRNTARTGMWLGIAGTVIGVAALTIVAIVVLIGIGIGIA